jgi:DNA-binding NtrC family response regulator
MQGYLVGRPLDTAAITAFLMDQPIGARQEDADGTRQTLLLVDDDPLMLSLLDAALHCDGYRILLANSAAEAFDLLALNDVQVILSDQNMPAMAGTEFFARVKEMYPHTFRIVLSGHADLESIMSAVNGGAVYRFYTKPWNNQQLRRTIQEAFALATMPAKSGRA